MRTLSAIPLFWSVDSVRAHAFEVLGGISGSGGV